MLPFHILCWDGTQQQMSEVIVRDFWAICARSVVSVANIASFVGDDGVFATGAL